MENIRGLILAAGQGTRMKSDLLKVLHPIMGKPMIALVLDALTAAEIPDPAVVVGFQADRVRDALGDAVDYVVQEEQRGTAHAVAQAAPLLEGYDDVLVLYGDVPLVTGDLLKRMVHRHRSSGAAATLLTAVVEDPSGLGRVVRDDSGELAAIVEDADASHAESAIREINTAIACFKVDLLLDCIPRIAADNAQGEYYLPDVFPMLLERGFSVETVQPPDVNEVLGVNTRADLAVATGILRGRILDSIMESGVTVVDPPSTWIDAAAEIGRDSVILPNTTIEGRCSLGSGCRVGPSVHLVASTLGDAVTVWHSVVEDSIIGDRVTIGPYAHLRPGNEVAENVKIGNFAELKNSRLGAGTKVPHHSYIGDAEVGSNVNIGAGVVTVNYDGWQKHLTVVDDGAFIGCNSNLLAPVNVGQEAFVAAGSTVDCDIPPGALGIARGRMEIKEGWVERKTGARRAERVFGRDEENAE